MDKRTKQGQEELILDHIRKHGSFTIFWITENQKRSHAAMRLEQSGKVTTTKLGFPNLKATINEEKNVSSRAKSHRDQTGW